MYAAAGIGVYWIVNLVDNQIEVFTEPEEAQGKIEYRTEKTYGMKDKVPVYIDGRKVGSVVLKDLT